MSKRPPFCPRTNWPYDPGPHVIVGLIAFFLVWVAPIAWFAIALWRG